MYCSPSTNPESMTNIWLRIYKKLSPEYHLHDYNDSEKLLQNYVRRKKLHLLPDDLENRNKLDYISYWKNILSTSLQPDEKDDTQDKTASKFVSERSEQSHDIFSPCLSNANKPKFSAHTLSPQKAFYQSPPACALTHSINLSGKKPDLLSTFSADKEILLTQEEDLFNHKSVLEIKQDEPIHKNHKEDANCDLLTDCNSPSNENLVSANNIAILKQITSPRDISNTPLSSSSSSLFLTPPQKHITHSADSLLPYLNLESPHVKNTSEMTVHYLQTHCDNLSQANLYLKQKYTALEQENKQLKHLLKSHISRQTYHTPSSLPHSLQTITHNLPTYSNSNFNSRDLYQQQYNVNPNTSLTLIPKSYPLCINPSNSTDPSNLTDLSNSTDLYNSKTEIIYPLDFNSHPLPSLIPKTQTINHPPNIFAPTPFKIQNQSVHHNKDTPHLQNEILNLETLNRNLNKPSNDTSFQFQDKFDGFESSDFNKQLDSANPNFKGRQLRYSNSLKDITDNANLAIQSKKGMQQPSNYFCPNPSSFFVPHSNSLINNNSPENNLNNEQKIQNNIYFKDHFVTTQTTESNNLAKKGLITDKSSDIQGQYLTKATHDLTVLSNLSQFISPRDTKLNKLKESIKESDLTLEDKKKLNSLIKQNEMLKHNLKNYYL